MTCPSDSRIGKPDEQGFIEIHGHLLEEITPEIINIYTFFEFSSRSIKSSGLMTDTLDLKRTNLIDADISSTVKINRLTNMISVKRIGVEHHGKLSLLHKGLGVGFSTIKYDNIYHIAGKREYNYSKPLGESEINWDFLGWWRGHWRAFYQKDFDGNTIVDSSGRNVVDYSRTGKNRSGDRNVKGYTWVIEHIRGDKSAEIKTHHVKAA